MRPPGFLITCLIAVLTGGTAQALSGELHKLARDGSVTEIVRLLDSGANLEERDATRETPLFAAAFAGRAKVVAELLKRGADINARNDRGLTPLDAAAYGGGVETVQLLVGAGAPVNDAENRYKVTPLIVAAEENHTEIVQFLIDHGAALETRERHGYTAVTRAGSKSKWDALAVLMKNGAVCQPESVDPIWFKECTKRRAELVP